MASAPIRNEDVIWREIDDRIVIISPDGLAIYTLNKTASRIWELCDGTRELEEIGLYLFERFEVSPEEAVTDVRETISKFEKMGLLQRR